ncbi:MAG: hypothetical protein CMN72_00075 [Sphingomonas sp.]|nr:hypothetical protein [Sphingomonas sp.]|tara:strand:+ start:14141 stop:14590 length:450 start_codon:yes stop_codon:yes gene_type:complete
MNLTVKIEKNIFEMISYCAPLAGGSLGIALFFTLDMISSLISGEGESTLSSLFLIITFLFTANLGMPRKLSVNMSTDKLKFEVYSLLGIKTYGMKKDNVIDIMIADNNDVKTCGLRVARGTLYVFNLYGYLLEPERHRDALKQLKEKWK